MTPPINIDGTQITGATIDGSDVTEITVDGTQVFNAIPTSGLSHRYDATEITGNDGDSVDTFEDKEGATDLTAGTALTLKTGSNGINGKNVIVSDGSDDHLDGQFGTTISEDFDIYLSGQFRTVTDGTAEVPFSANSNAVRFVADRDSPSLHQFFQGDVVDGSAADTNPHVMTARWGASTDVFRLDGAQDFSGDSGSTDLDGLTIGTDENQNQPANFAFGEILVYNSQLSDADRNSVEEFLADKWGVTL